MDPDLGSLHKVLTAFENGEWDEVHLVTGEFELHLTTAVTDGHSGEPLAARAAATAAATPAAVTTKGASPTNGAAASASDADESTGSAGTAAPVPPNGILVEAPSVGIFWAAPSPGAPPFVSIGDDVTEGSTLCIVEVMKLMNHLKSPAVGRVVDVLVKNGDSLVAGQPVFVIDPDPAAGA